MVKIRGVVTIHGLSVITLHGNGPNIPHTKGTLILLVRRRRAKVLYPRLLTSNGTIIYETVVRRSSLRLLVNLTTSTFRATKGPLLNIMRKRSSTSRQVHRSETSFFAAKFRCCCCRAPTPPKLRRHYTKGCCAYTRSDTIRSNEG